MSCLFLKYDNIFGELQFLFATEKEARCIKFHLFIDIGSEVAQNFTCSNLYLTTVEDDISRILFLYI